MIDSQPEGCVWQPSQSVSTLWGCVYGKGGIVGMFCFVPPKNQTKLPLAALEAWSSPGLGL